MEDAPNVGPEAATQREAGVKGSLTSALDARAGPRAQALSPGLPRAPGANWTEPGERGPERHQAHEGEITPRSRQGPIEAKDQDPKHEAKGPIQGGRVPHDASLFSGYNGMVRTAPGAACSRRRPVLLPSMIPAGPPRWYPTARVSASASSMAARTCSTVSPRRTASRAVGWLRPRVSRTSPWSRAVRARTGAAASVSPDTAGSTVTIPRPAPVAAANR